MLAVAAGMLGGQSMLNPARAQAPGGLSTGQIGPVPNLGPADESGIGSSKPRVQPPALPGARTDPSRVTPSQKSFSEMNPTDALFDAINRGDVTAARDAIDRGADLGGHNVLGMSPLDLSIDLGRNDISFLLLSQRGAGPGASAPSTQLAKAGAPAPKPARQPHSRVATATVREAAPPAPRTAQLFSGNGGAPVPSAGFLGFGAGPSN